MSGDPTPGGVTLWTRLYDVDRTGSVRLEVAKDSDFRRVVARKRITTGESLGHSVKARVSGLRPHERYYYRFETEDDSSRVGRFQTALPADSNERVRFAFFSCQDLMHGYFNAHDAMAKEEIDFAVCLGNYIYAESGPRIYAPLVSGIEFVRGDPIDNAKTLAQYRRKYTIYRSDERLRALHASVPLITTWGDHEVSGNFFGGSPIKGEYYSASKHSPKRTASGRKAFFENMPLYSPDDRHRIYRALRFGRNVELVMLDERQYRQNQPCQRASSELTSGIDEPCDQLAQDRQLLGAEQLKFLKRRLRDHSSTWKLVGNEVLTTPVQIADSRYFSYDSWGGYSKQRSDLLDFLKQNDIKDVAFLTGDLQNFIAGNVLNSTGETVATEFVGGSITTATLGESTVDIGQGLAFVGDDNSPDTAEGLRNYLLELNPWVKGYDSDHHGYGLVEATGEQLKVSFRRVSTIKRKRYSLLPAMSWTLERGQVGIE